MDFQITYLQEAIEFLRTLDEKAQDKIFYNIERAKCGADPNLLSKLNRDIWEFRTLYRGVKYRLLCFWDTDVNTLIVATHGFVKKTQKTPTKEIEKAEYWRKIYFNEKYKKANKS